MEAEVLAHVRELPNGNWLGHELRDHLESVRPIPSVFEESLNSSRRGLLCSNILLLQ